MLKGCMWHDEQGVHVSDEKKVEGRLNAEQLRVAIIVDDMVEKRSIDDLTVAEICDAANLSRTQFYRLFDSKYEIANWFLYKVVEPGKTQIGRTLTWEQGVEVTMQGCFLLKNLMRSSFLADGYQSMRETAKRTHKREFFTTIADYKKRELTDSIRFQIDFYFHAEDHMNKIWFLNEEREPAHEYAHRLAACVPGELFELLNDPVNPCASKEITLAMLAR